MTLPSSYSRPSSGAGRARYSSRLTKVAVAIAAPNAKFSTRYNRGDFMPLTSGTRVGAYEIVAPIGAGGMGEVYRARDTKLAREVAIKVLPEAFADDPDRLSNFALGAAMA